MHRFNELDKVQLKIDIKKLDLRKGAPGIIVLLHPDENDAEVEFKNEGGKAFLLTRLRLKFLEPID